MPRPQSRQLTEMITSHLGSINERLVTSATRPGWEREVRALIRGYAPLTWETPAGEDAEQRSTRANVLWTAGYIGRDPNVIAGAMRVAERYLSDPASVDVTIAGPALEIAAVNGDEALYRTIRQKLDSAPTAEVRDRYATLLAQFRDPKLIAQTIDYTFSDAVRTQDLPRMIGRIFGNPEGREAIWQAVTERWPQIQKSIPTSLGSITGSLGSFCDPKAKAAIEAFFAKQPLTEGSRALRRSLESIDTCIAFREAQKASFESALK
jgi:hypothetical protein